MKGSNVSKIVSSYITLRSWVLFKPVKVPLSPVARKSTLEPIKKTFLAKIPYFKESNLSESIKKSANNFSE